MSSRVPGIPDELQDFLFGVWNTNCRNGDLEGAHELMRDSGIEADVRRFLLDAIFRSSIPPDKWEDLFNVHAPTPQMVREDAVEFWEWLYGEPPARAELDVLGAAPSSSPSAAPMPGAQRRLASWHRVMLTLRRARAFLPDSAQEFATRDPRNPDSIISLASYDESMEA